MAEIPPPESVRHLNEQLQHLEYLVAALQPHSMPSAWYSHLKSPMTFLPMHRGRMYEAYSQLRESKLQRKKSEADAARTTPKKKVTFVGATPLVNRNKLAVGQSVPDLSAMLRKENKKPSSEVTPPMAAGSKAGWRGGGSKSASGGEKRGGGQGILRKSCVNLKELKGMSAATAFAIDEEGRGGGGGRNRVMKKGALWQ